MFSWGLNLVLSKHSLVSSILAPSLFFFWDRVLLGPFWCDFSLGLRHSLTCDPPSLSTWDCDLPCQFWLSSSFRSSTDVFFFLAQLLHIRDIWRHCRWILKTVSSGGFAFSAERQVTNKMVSKLLRLLDAKECHGENKAGRMGIFA